MEHVIAFSVELNAVSTSIHDGGKLFSGLFGTLRVTLRCVAASDTPGVCN